MLKKIFIVVLFIFITIGLAFMAVLLHPVYPVLGSTDNYTAQYPTWEEKKQFLDSTPFVIDGQWEFYADRWIVDDQYTGESDGQIDFFKRTNKKFTNGDNIPYHRFASYKHTVSADAFLGDVIIVTPYRHNYSYRVFINKQLVCQSGEMLKGENNLVARNTYKRLNEYHIGFDCNLDIVIETFSVNGEILEFAPILKTANNFNSEFSQVQEWGKALSVSIWILSGLFLLAVLICLIFNTLKDNWQYPAIMALFIINFILYYNQTSAAAGFLALSSAILFVLINYFLRKAQFERLDFILQSVSLALLCYILAVRIIETTVVVHLLYFLPSYWISLCVFVYLLSVYMFKTARIVKAGVAKNKELAQKINSIKNQDLKNQILNTKHDFNSKIEIYTFGTFNILLDGYPLDFSSKKAKELLALLVDANGDELSMSQAITYLYPDKEPELSNKSYRDLVLKLKRLFCEYDLDNLILINRGGLAINKNIVDYCDYWQALEGKSFNGNVDEYMPIYDWSAEKIAFIGGGVQTMGDRVFVRCFNLNEIKIKVSTKPEGWDQDWNLGITQANIIWGYNQSK